jgi:uncharacterized protein YjbJ (UPF0337 family)
MDWTVIERMWTQAKGRIQSKWDKLTKEDLELIAGRRDRLEAKIRHVYGFSPDHVRWLMIGFVGRSTRSASTGQIQVCISNALDEE